MTMTRSESIAASTRRAATMAGALISLAVFAVFLALFQMPPLRQAALDVELAAGFHLRKIAGHAPTLSPRLKVVLYDDSTFALFQRSGLNLEEWAWLLETLDARSPRAIYIDKIFGVLEDTTGTAGEAFKRLAALKAPVVSGSFVSPVPIAMRPPLEVATHTLETPSPAPPLAQKEGWRAYGGTPEHQKVFKTGHISYEGTAKVAALIGLGRNRALPHLTLADARWRKIEGGKLIVNDNPVPLSSEGEVIVNFAPAEAIYRQAITIADLVALAQQEKEVEAIAPGDVVLILPGHFTGGSDFKKTPVGSIPGGFILASMLNSVLTNQWLHEFPWPSLLFAMVAVVAGATGWVKRSVIVPWLVLGTALTAGAGLALFVLASWVVPWGFLTTQMLATSLFAIGYRIRLEKRSEVALRETEEELERSRRESERLAKEMKDAAEIARAFAPDPVPRWEGIDIRGFHRILDAASGDWFFFENSPSGRYHHCGLCDITGHGVQAALVVSSCKTTLSLLKRNSPALLDTPDFPFAFAKLLNEILFAQGNGNHTTTMVAATFLDEGRLLRAARYGHPAPLLLHKGKISALSQPGSVLGLSAEMSGPICETALEPGDTVFLYSDGIPLQRQRRLLAPARENGLFSEPDKLVNLILEEDRKRNNDPDDDRSLIIFQVGA